MSGTNVTALCDELEHGLTGPAADPLDGRPERSAASSERTACFHCGEPCRDDSFAKESKVFCCQGCLVVHDLLAESGLGQFYDLDRHPGVRVRRSAGREQWAYLDESPVRERLLDFTDGKLSRVTFHIPAMHCVACVWLLENLFRLHPGIGRSQANFPKREVAISFSTGKIALSELVALLVSIGYEPVLTLGELEKARPDLALRRQRLQVGIAGFAFGNIMLVSLPLYLGMDSLSGPVLGKLFGYLSLGLAAPVLLYSASDYWRSALLSLRQRVLTLDVPIALGLAALYAQSAYEILSGRGGGYLDSLAGLVFFLLCGRVFQQKTHDRLAFDRNYKSFFPLSATRKTASGDEVVAISSLRAGDRLVLRNGELIPADAKLVGGPAFIDYSFVTGESEPVAKEEGAYLYAGGQQMGGAIEVETVKPVSQSYLTTLWNHEAFQKDREDNLNTLTNRYSRRFTRLVIAAAAAAALFWTASGDSSRALKAFTSVLIVACPCALALAAPFTLGTAQRLLTRGRVFLRNALVIERMAQVDAIVFDKTGTLTAARSDAVSFHGPALSAEEARLVYSLTRHSTHPHSVRISESFSEKQSPLAVDSFAETPGGGIEGTVEGRQVRLGSRSWLVSRGVAVPELGPPPGGVACVTLDGQYRGAYVLGSALRPDTGRLLRRLAGRYEIALLSGDNERDRERFAELFGDNARLNFNQSPLDKLSFIRAMQKSGRTVMMAGDGLNDAGALRQSDVGVAVVERMGVFSPASDVIMEASGVPRLFEILALARRAALIVRLSFLVSAVYNLVGIAIAASGLLSPVICAILMPLSSVSVVLFACGTTHWAARRLGLGE